MDEIRFDSLTRSLTTAGSRRRVLVATLGGAFGLLGWQEVDEIAAHNPSKGCKKKSGKQKKKCLKQAKAHNASHLISVPPPPPPVAPLACGAGGPCLVFLSSTLYGGNLGGFSGGDAKCQGLATDAGLPGTYKAWLSDTTSSPSSRFVRSSGPYRLVTGTTIADNWADLTDGTLLAPINVTETGGGIGSASSVWTHTLITGNAGGGSNTHCLNWSTSSPGSLEDPLKGDTGSSHFSHSGWTHTTGPLCSNIRHLYCFQQR